MPVLYMCWQVAPFREHGMGWGLKVVKDVPKNTLIGEYIGEVGRCVW